MLTANNEYIGEILLSKGVVDQSMHDKALRLAEEEETSIIDILVHSGLLVRADVMRVLANHNGMEYMTLKGADVEHEVLDMVPAEVARRYNVVPVYMMDGVLTVAITDPFDMETLDTLGYVLKYPVNGVVAEEKEIHHLMDTYYPRTGQVETMLEELTQSSVDVSITDTGLLQQSDESISEEDAPIIKLVSLIIIEAFRKRASDIHIEPFDGKLRVRYRIDGVLHEVESPPKRLQNAIISRLKIMAEMKIDEKNIPQDGRIQINVMGRDLDLRVSTVPSVHGESIVMRILDKENLKLGLPELGFLSDDKATFDRLIRLPDGIVLVTGPTGSGKTTTLYSCLNEINKPDRKIITVEDPVEYNLSGINQVAVRAGIGLTFASALRSILRQAPNIIMIGEIRDMETAEIAVNASLTGHLVFSTLHTNDAPSAVTRMVDIGMKPFLVASSVRAIMAQRLVRSICSRCSEPYKANTHDLRLLGASSDQLAGAELVKGAGCDACAGTGYKGRKGLFEIFEITEEVQHMINRGVTATELRIKARELGMRTLREDGLRKVIGGMTTLEEVFRVTMGDED